MAEELENKELEGKEEKKEFGAEVEIGGEKFMVDENLAKAINASNEENDEKFTEFQTNITQQMEEKIASITPEKKEKEKEENASDRFYNDPLGYLNENNENLKNDIINAVRGEYVQEKSKDNFWSGFYKENDDLKDNDFIVQAVLSRDMNELKDLKTSKAMKELGDRTRKELLKLKPESKGNKAPVVEGEVEKSVTAEVKGDDKVLTLSDIIKQRAETRRKARVSGGAN